MQKVNFLQHINNLMSLYKQPFLEPYKGRGTRHTCPNCKVKQTFTLYLDGNTCQPIHPTVGKCNREIKCGYHYPPREYFADHPELWKNGSREYKPQSNNIPIRRQSANRRPGKHYNTKLHSSLAVPPKMDLIPRKYVKESVSANSNFVRFLCKHFPRENVKKAIENYALGATKNGSVIFWQIDIKGNVRTGKIMQYNPDTGKRIKHKSGAINWVHNILKRRVPNYTNYNLNQCYFGEHLLKFYPNKPIAIVEAEKTAVIASMIYSNYNWLAAGNLNGLNTEKSKVLRDKHVILFPDAGCYEKWSRKAVQLKSVMKQQIKVSDLVEKHAIFEQRENGYDIADYIIEEIR
ncbi:DUF6371 domain-containing protein [Proteiniphilum propionicum]|uniref:DUF6371 domain-containing protein n=1 Tax=Proteiniphilum propionicum TaxID=2829812 RepID=UPI001EEA30BC|nr:DUF6371 domain-containing protein [Proteiniphilum propionicum]ULB35154.1 hypothetical protein KDN43_03690 [Proteiniphilum propionicum]